ncbi:MAG: serine protease Do [Patescibacteria group bacterium]|nr:serine protease Do [Patescibacteria group bacterium]
MLKKKELDVLIKTGLFGFILICFVFSVFSHLQGVRRDQQIQKNYFTQIGVVKKELADTKKIVKALVDGNSELAQNLEEERSKREQSEATVLASEKKLAALTANLDAGDITKIITEWSGRVVKIECIVEFTDGTNKKSTASGVATTNAGVTEIYTSKHVVEEKGVLAKECQVKSEDGTIEVVADIIKADSSKDLAILSFSKSVRLPITAMTAVKKCTIKPVLGDQVVILGYPSVGSSKGVTATDGIISGSDKDFYITSAKIERGNSGGAAIYVKNNCLLGLPTLVVAGQVESLARILAL